MSKFLIHFATGEGNITVQGDLEKAKKIAVKHMSYTQRPVVIFQFINGEKVKVTESKWYGVAAEADDVALADFGEFGFYSEWWDM